MTKEPLFEYTTTPSNENPTFAKGRVTQTGEEFYFSFKGSVAALYIYPSSHINVFRTDPLDPVYLRYSANLGLGSRDGRAGRTLVDGLLTHWLIDYAKKPSIRLSDDSGIVVAPINAVELKSDHRLKFHIEFSMRQHNVHSSARRLFLNIDALEHYVFVSATRTLPSPVKLNPVMTTTIPAVTLGSPRRQIEAFDLAFPQASEDIQRFAFEFSLHAPLYKRGQGGLNHSSVLEYFRDKPCKVYVSWDQDGSELTSNVLSYVPAMKESQHD